MTAHDLTTVDANNPMRLTARFVRGYQLLASRQLLACAFVLFLTLGLRAALLPWLPVPQPMDHDEFSYLLAADTYLHGRLANPSQPFWEHFETFHVLQQPAYASKYQPLQGFVLAFGQKFFGQPWIGVYLAGGVMCASICWMLQGWIAPEWALLGALFFALRVGVLSYWMNSYLPGAVPAIGGALALGALIRVGRRNQFGHSITWAVGLSITALSRPYDAAVLACATAAILLWLVRKSSAPRRVLCTRLVLPAMAVLAMCGALIAYNDYRVTGRALVLPAQVYEREYAVVSMGVFSVFPLGPEPAYRHSAMRELYVGDGVKQWTYARKHPLVFLAIKLYILDSFFFPFWPLLVPMLLCPYDLHTPEERATVLLLITAVAMTAPLILSQPHYVAVFAGLFYLRFLQTVTRLQSWHPSGKPVGPALGVALVAVLTVGLCFNFFSLIHSGGGRDFSSELLLSQGAPFAAARQTVIQKLQRQAGGQLVLVRYSPNHDPHKEWVFNGADINDSQIVWAREMGPAQDGPFLEYFRNRKIWVLEPDRSPPQITPYPSEALR